MLGKNRNIVFLFMTVIPLKSNIYLNLSAQKGLLTLDKHQKTLRTVRSYNKETDSTVYHPDFAMPQAFEIRPNAAHKLRAQIRSAY